MAERVLVHIGLPKTATTYLQTIMWDAPATMRAHGVLLPGRGRTDHLWTARTVCEAPSLETAHPRQRNAWQRVRAEIAEWPGDAVITHEFLAAASAEQAGRMVADLAPAQVEVVITAREPIGLFTTSWQESLKNRGVRRLPDYPGPASQNPSAIWNWRTLDLGLVLERWGEVVPADRVHILPLPPRGAPRDLIWQRFATLVGLDPAAFDATTGFANTSMGVAEAETLRRINEHLVERDLLGTALERGTIIRTLLADEHLVPRGGERYWPEPEQIEDCRRRGLKAIAMIEERGFDVIGDLADLESPEQLEARRTIGSVTDAEIAEIATDLVAQLAAEIRELRRKLRAARLELERPPEPPAPTRRQRIRARLGRLLVWRRR